MALVINFFFMVNSWRIHGAINADPFYHIGVVLMLDFWRDFSHFRACFHDCEEKSNKHMITPSDFKITKLPLWTHTHTAIASLSHSQCPPITPKTYSSFDPQFLSIQTSFPTAASTGPCERKCINMASFPVWNNYHFEILSGFDWRMTCMIQILYI